VIVYDRNRVTNRILQDHGIKTIEIPGSELARGRGGPRCMSMPLWRDEVAG
jgi:arginine deiminase